MDKSTERPDTKRSEKQKEYVAPKITDLTLSLAQVQPLGRSYNTSVTT